MKKFLLYAASLATIAFTGCSKEQSELSVDDVKAKATISGKVTYDGGSYYDKTEAKTVSFLFPPSAVPFYVFSPGCSAFRNLHI